MLNKIAAGIAIAIVVVLGHTYLKHEAVQEATKQAVETTTAKLNTEYQKKLETSQKAAKKVTEALQDNANKQSEKKDETIRTIIAERDVAISKLRNRPQRPASTNDTNHSPSGEACTARELYREDAEFLTREAARAETVIAERDYYFQQYEEVREKVNGLTK